MPKPGSRTHPAGTGGAPKRRTPRPAADPPSPARKAPAGPLSDPMRLAVEVARLEAELEAMRSRVRELEAHADRDPLTGLFNRRGFARELKRAASFVQRYGARAVLVYIDLDRFKPVNDRHGHAAGDAVLRAVAVELAAHVRASDTVGRLGGDEFGLILWNLSEEDALAKALALEGVVAAATVTWGEAELTVGASAGTAALAGQDEPDQVLARADAAMYGRKRRDVRR